MREKMLWEPHRVQLLMAEHRALDERLRELARRPFWTPSDEREVCSLKKKKLRTKDVLSELSRARVSM